jgi:hypothetical protein
VARRINGQHARHAARHPRIQRRRKLRLRWYDSLHPGRDFAFEIKWRYNHVTGKRRLHVRSDKPLIEMPYEGIASALSEVLPEEYAVDLRRYPEPMVMVEYRREHFVSRTGCARITLDYDVAFYDQMGKPRICTSSAQRLQDFIVLEGKAPIGSERELRSLFYSFAPTAGWCSKYVRGCRVLGLISSEQKLLSACGPDVSLAKHDDGLCV